jgi:hypothetical protein
MRALLRWFKSLFVRKEEMKAPAPLKELERKRSRTVQEESKETTKKESKPRASKNFVYADINSTKEVLLMQVLMEIVADPAFKDASAKEKEALKRRLDGIFSLQFDQLIARLQKKLS